MGYISVLSNSNSNSQRKSWLGQVHNSVTRQAGPILKFVHKKTRRTRSVAQHRSASDTIGDISISYSLFGFYLHSVPFPSLFPIFRRFLLVPCSPEAKQLRPFLPTGRYFLPHGYRVSWSTPTAGPEETRLSNRPQTHFGAVQFKILHLLCLITNSVVEAQTIISFCRGPCY